MKLYEPGHEKTCLMTYANNKGADQPAHPCSLISAFVVHCLDSVMSLVPVTKISSLMLASVAEQASLSLTWSKTPEDMFSHDEAHMYFRDQSRNLLISDHDEDWSGWSDDKNSWNDGGNNDDDDALEAWLNDDSSTTKSSKNKLNKKTNKGPETDDWDRNDWETLDGADKKSIKSSRNAKKKETLVNTNDGWDSVDFNETSSSSNKRADPLVGNLLDLGIDDSASNRDTNLTNEGWDNEVWAEADDDEWQSLDIDSKHK